MIKFLQIAAIGLGTVILFGCGTNAPTTQPLTETQRQDAILNDPMGYKPHVGRDITGGDITHVGNGIDQDVNDVLNP